MLPVAVARSSSDVMYFRFYGRRHGFRTWDQYAESRKTLCSEVIGQVALPYQSDVRQLWCLVEFVRMRHRGRSPISTIVLLYPPSEQSELARYYVMLLFRPSVRLSVSTQYLDANISKTV